MRAACSKLFPTFERQFSTNTIRPKIVKESLVKATRTKDYPRLDSKLKSNKRLRIAEIVTGVAAVTIGYDVYRLHKSGHAITTDNFKELLVDDYNNAVNPLIYDIKNTMFPDKTCKLPDPYVEDGQQPPRTIVIRLQNGLVGEVFSNDMGTRYYKRNGLDHFITSLSSSYEIVLSCTNELDSEQIIFKIDPSHVIPYRLYENHWKKENGKKVRNIESINRDPKRCIIIDSDEDYFQDKDNILVIPDINKIDAKHDTTLDRLIPILTDIYEKDVEDVRTYIKDIGGSKDYFEGYQKKVQEEHAEREKQRMQYMMPAAVETPEPQPSVATENGETLALTTDELRFGNPILSSPEMYGVFPQVIRDKKTGEFKWNPQANDFPPELTEEELQQFIPPPQLNNEEFDVKNHPTVWQRMRLELKKREQDRNAQIRAMLKQM